MKEITQNNRWDEWLLHIVLLLVAQAGLPANAGSTCPEAAHQAYQQGVEVGHKYTAGCGESCIAEKRYFFNRAVTICPTYAEAHNNLGDVYENLGRYPTALAHYTRATQLAPDLAVAHLSLGDVYLHIGEYIKAVQAYDRGLMLDPDDRLGKSAQRAIAQRLLNNGGVPDSEAIETLLGGAPLKTMGPAGIRPDRRIAIQIPFAFNSDQLLVKAQAPLQALGKSLQKILMDPAATYATFLIEGHTDMRGSEKHNLALSERRAHNVVEALVRDYQIPRKRLQVKRYGEVRPLTEGVTEADHARNRRVEVVRVDSSELFAQDSQVGGNPVQIESRTTSDQIVLQAAVFYEDSESRPRKLAPGGVLRSGDGYRIYVEPQQPGYLYIFQIDVSGKLVPLYPNPEYGTWDNAVKSRVAHWVPDKDRWFELDHKTGTETIYIVATRERRADIEDLLARYARAEVSVPKVVNHGELIEHLNTMGVAGVRPGRQVQAVSSTGQEVRVVVDELVRTGEGLVYPFTFRHE